MNPFETIKNELAAIGKMCIERKLTVAVAESVTSGYLQAALSGIQDARRFFQGGITAYNLGQKCRWLDVEPIEAEEINSVAAAVSRQMAEKAAKHFLADIGIGITGYAAPVPEKSIRETHAFVCIAGEVTMERRIDGRSGEGPVETQLHFASQAMIFFVEMLHKKGRL